MAGFLAIPLTLLLMANALLTAIEAGHFGEWVLWSAATFVTNLVSVCVIGASVLAAERRGHRDVRARFGVASLAVALSATFTAALIVGLSSLTYGYAPPTEFFLRIITRHVVLGSTFCIVREIHRRLVASIAATHQAEADQIAGARDMAEARLQALQAQVEPHFLFNTLANVRRLYQIDSTIARAMLDNLMRYLEVALPHMRGDHSTLGREAALTDAFLQVHRIRMGRRLAYEIRVPEDLEHVVIPSMMLLTLVENAVKHGLNPLPEGGEIVVTASVDATDAGDRLGITVADTGRGFDPDAMGHGTGLANLRARLATMRDPRARVDVESNRPRGVIATLSLPHERPAATIADGLAGMVATR